MSHIYLGPDMKNTSYYSVSRDEEDLLPRKRPKSESAISPSIKTRIVFGSAVAILLVVCLFLSTTRDRFVIPLSVSSHFDAKAEMKKVARPLKIVKRGTRSINYTLKRPNYEALSYFGDDFSSALTYSMLSEYRAVVEPYQKMEFYLYNSDSHDSGVFDYEVCTSGSSPSCQSGQSVIVKGGVISSSSIKFGCSPHDTFDIKVTMRKEAGGEVVATQVDQAVCMYVRRELRNLSPDDLSAFINASYIHTITSDEAGSELYGDSYYSYPFLVRLHFFNAAQQDQDHIHEGNGFLMQHVKLNNFFESSLQLIDPSVSLPYWDYTYDAKTYSEAKDSLIVRKDTFGGMKQPSTLTSGFTYTNDHIVDGAIPDGKWEKLEMLKNNEYPELQFGYGYLRAPWNFNPSPYVSRFAFDFSGGLTLPQCQSHYNILQYTDMMNFFDAVSFAPHGTAHTMIAGFYGCDKFSSLVDQGLILDENHANNLCAIWSYILKDIWRYNYIQVNAKCTVAEDIDSSYCGFECKEEDKDTLATLIAEMAGSLVDSNNVNWKDGIYSFVCGAKSDGGAVFTGDHLESASPVDPSFWVIHPTIERLFHAKLMSGGFLNEAWRSNPLTDYVCEHSACYNMSTSSMDYYQECCYGHYEDDRMLDAVSGDRYQRFGPTNREVLEATDPRLPTYSMPYIYDQFSWDHCNSDAESSQPFDFVSMLSGLAEQAINNEEIEVTASELETISDRQQRLEYMEKVRVQFQSKGEESSEALSPKMKARRDRRKSGPPQIRLAEK